MVERIMTSYQTHLLSLLDKLKNQAHQLQVTVKEGSHPLSPAFETDLLFKLITIVADLEKLEDVKRNLEKARVGASNNLEE